MLAWSIVSSSGAASLTELLLCSQYIDSMLCSLMNSRNTFLHHRHVRIRLCRCGGSYVKKEGQPIACAACGKPPRKRLLCDVLDECMIPWKDTEA